MRRNTGEDKSRATYMCWAAMKARCLKPSNPSYKNYGGRGIRVCERWLNSFANFLADMGEKPEGLTIDRINNDGDYEPSNCRWITREAQQRNKTTSKMLTIDGATRCVGEWAEIVGMNRKVIYSRLRLGWSPRMAVHTPSQRGVHRRSCHAKS